MLAANRVSLTFNCPVAASELQPVEGGNHCKKCDKLVHDYTKFTDQELIVALRQNPSGCGSFRADQLDRDLTKQELKRRGYSLAGIALLLALQLLGHTGSFAQQSDTPLLQTTELQGIHSPSAEQTTSIPQVQMILVNGDGEPLIGASIAILDISEFILGGHATDVNGLAKIELPESAVTVRVSYVGFKTQEILITDLNSTAIELSSMMTSLETVIIKAYKGDPMRVDEGMYGSTITTDSTTFIDPFKNPKASLIYPNPSLGDATLRLQNPGNTLLVNVYALTGQLIYSAVPDKYAQEIQLTLSHQLVSGTYLVEQVDMNNETVTTRMIVQ